MNYNVTVIPGDGIGPEIVREARKVLDQVGKVFGHSFDYTAVSYTHLDVYKRQR